MKKIFFILFSIVVTFSESQNLVPNGSFEDTLHCGDHFYYIDNASGWNGFQTVDYYNVCVIPFSSGGYDTDVPNNFYGFQYPKKGNAYVGLSNYCGYNCREYLYRQLSQQLQAGKYYCVSFSLAVAQKSAWAINRFGAYFSNDTLNPEPFLPDGTGPPWNFFTYYIPQVEDTTMISDTLEWTTVSGTFQAAGNEKFITLGNFRDDIDTDTLRVHWPVSNGDYNYYYLDEVYVEEVSTVKAGNDTTFYLNDSLQLGNNPTENASYVWFPAAGLSDPYAANPKAAPVGTTTYIVTKTQCSITTMDTVTVTSLGLGINEKNEITAKIYPNPADESVIIELKNVLEYQISIINNLGQVVSERSIRSNKELVNTSAYPNGLYFIKIQNLASSATFYDKIVVFH